MGALMKWLSGEAVQPAGKLPQLHRIEVLRERSAQVLADCTRPHADRVRVQLNKAVTAQQLWLMRSDLYQTVARQHCEAEAVRRLNELLPMFEGWLPPGALTRLGQGRTPAERIAASCVET
ncbi:MAG: hypothetical protein JWQ07_2886 [Ramlibacter sp.]|nr:hypothetical protein [Ramlibacter sp.]